MTNGATHDIAAILETLRAEVKARRQGMAGAERSALEQQLDRCIEQLEITRVVSAHWPLEGRNPVERAWVLLHKVVRRYLRWYINPIVEQQNAFNDTAARTLRLLVEAYGDLRAQTDDQETPPGGPALPANKQAVATSIAPAQSAELRRLTDQLTLQQTVSAHWPLKGRSPQDLSRALARRVVRQYLRWLINPIVEQQNAFNAALTSAIPALLAVDAERSRVPDQQ